MATKDNLLLSRNFIDFTNQNSQLQYSNLNLNNIRGGDQSDILNSNQSNGFMISSKYSAGNEYGSKQHSAMRSSNHQVQQLIRKWESRISSNNLGNKKSNKVINEQSNSSNLLLHIAAYENTIQDQKLDDNDVGGRKKSKYSSFEIPRQQKDDPKEPEIMKYKASQKLANPTSQQQQPTSNDTQKQPQKKTTPDSNNDVVLYSASIRDEYLKEMAEAEKRKKEVGLQKTIVELDTGYSLNPPENEKLPDDFKTDKHEYKFVRKLGEGVDGAVYEVINEKKELYACKLADMGYGLFNEVQIMRLAESIQSSHFCQFEEAGFTGDSYYCVFELLGSELSKIVKEASETKLLILCKQSLEAIQDMHRLGYLHHDLHDDNLAIGRPGTAKAQTVVIYDFGFSETIKEDKIGTEKLLEEKCDIYLKKNDLVEWLRMCLNWFNCNFENEYQSDEKKIRLEGCPEKTKENFERISQLNENLKGFRYIYQFIKNLQPGHLPDYSFMLTIIEFMLQMSHENTFWLPGVIYNPPHPSLKEPIKSIYDKYRPPFYEKSQRYKTHKTHVVEYYGTHLNLKHNGAKSSDRGEKTVEVFECRPNQYTKCTMRIEVYGYDKTKIQPGDEVEIYKVVNWHSCAKGKNQSRKPQIHYPRKDNFVDFSMFE